MMKPNDPRHAGQHTATAGGPARPEDLFTFYISLDPKQRPEHFVTTEQAATLANVSRRAIQRWIAEGHVRAVQVAARFYIQRTSLIDYLKRRSQAKE